jgi:trk system potassium uptake protein TrkH
MRKRDLITVGRLVADFLYGYGFLLLVPAVVALLTAEYTQALCFGVGALLFIPVFYALRRRVVAAEVEKRHAAVALALTWTLLSLFSSVPFVVLGMGWVDALFESFSAWTDTGLTMIPDPAGLPYSLSLFRVLMQWISGLGIVMFMLGVQGPSPRAAQSLFAAEGRSEDFATNLWQVGRTIVLIYTAYTLMGFLAFLALRVPAFHALTHAITSLSTGGFSTNSVGVGWYGTLPSIVAMVLMLCGGISFGSHHALITGKIKRFLRNPEIKVLFVVIVLASTLLLLEQAFLGQGIGEGRLGDRLLESVFYVISAISTCGAGTTLPLVAAPPTFRFTILLLMISGAAYGSTTGALKLWRLIVVGQVIGREIRLPFYPRGAALPICVGSNVVSERAALQVAAYALLYAALALVGSLIFMLFGYDSLDALFTVFSAQGNVGLNGMSDALYYGMHPALKLQLVFHMLLGRMEILPFLYLLHGLRR